MSYIKLVQHLVDAITGKPDGSTVESTEENQFVNLFVKVDPEDVGKIIGKNGSIITAIRHMASASGTKNQQRIYVKILSTEDSLPS